MREACVLFSLGVLELQRVESSRQVRNVRKSEEWSDTRSEVCAEQQRSESRRGFEWKWDEMFVCKWVSCHAQRPCGTCFFSLYVVFCLTQHINSLHYWCFPGCCQIWRSLYHCSPRAYEPFSSLLYWDKSVMQTQVVTQEEITWMRINHCTCMFSPRTLVFLMGSPASISSRTTSEITKPFIL